jgi:plastocyanin
MSAIVQRLISSRLRCAIAGLGLLASTVGTGAAQQGGRVSGRVTVLERGDKPARDVGEAIVWLEAARPAAVTPVAAQVVAADKEFRPRITVVPLGSTVSFPNTDAFDHNVFSLAQEAQFDLGLYGRGQTKSYEFTKPGLIRVYCNVHAQMSAFVMVRDAPWYAQPAGDGSFVIPGVPPGEYVVHAWHERAVPFAPQTIRVPAGGTGSLDLTLDARGYKFVQHLNKFGQPYGRRGRRY